VPFVSFVLAWNGSHLSLIKQHAMSAEQAWHEALILLKEAQGQPIVGGR
jgi:hypothetical protein